MRELLAPCVRCKTRRRNDGEPQKLGAITLESASRNRNPQNALGCHCRFSSRQAKQSAYSVQSFGSIACAKFGSLDDPPKLFSTVNPTDALNIKISTFTVTVA